MKNIRSLIAALSMFATLLCASTAMATPPSLTFYAAGSSGQFPSIMVAAAYNIYGTAPLCGTHHWSKKNSSALPIVLHDPRSSSILDEGGNITVVWDDNAAANNGGTICYYVTVDSVIGVRLYQASAQLSLASGLSGSASIVPDIVPLIGTGETLNANVFATINGSKLNAGFTDIRPEDAKFATMRALTAKGTQVTGKAATGLGYGPFPVGTGIKSSQSSAIFFPVDFSIDPGDTDPVNPATPVRRYVEMYVGAAPIMVFYNSTNTGAGHFGDPILSFTNINRFVLANILTGSDSHVRDVLVSGISSTQGDPTVFPFLAPTENVTDVGIRTFIREPMSGTYNTMEYSIPNSREVAGIPSWGVGKVEGQEQNVDPTNNSCTVFPCTVESGNPLYHIYSNGGTFARAVGSGEEITSVNNTADGFGYSFWGYPAFQGKTHIKYLTVDGADPLYSGPSANPGGPGAFPSCTVDGSGNATSCPNIPFPNVINGSYPIWQKYRMIYDANDTTNIATTLIKSYAWVAAGPVVSGVPGSNLFTDFVVPSKMGVFRSHYAQVIRDSGVATAGNNGFKAGNYETGGDAGGATLTIQSEYDFNTDTGNQQIDLYQ